MYKQRFKYYKSKASFPKLDNVYDFNNLKDMSQVKHFSVESNSCYFGLIPPKDWKLYELKERPGLLFLRNPFTPSGQRYWIVRCLKYYSRKPNKTNLDKYYVLPDDTSWWDYAQSVGATDLLDKLRWVTFGYHHDWDTKVYSETSFSTFPEDLGGLCCYLAKHLGFTNFKAEAAIVNYYHMDSTLSGHTDHSEDNLEAPLFSFSFDPNFVECVCQDKVSNKNISTTPNPININTMLMERNVDVNNQYEHTYNVPSLVYVEHLEINIGRLFPISFGQTAIFLLGGKTIEEDATPMFLRSGDIVIMSKESRLCYHGVPKILPADSTPWMDSEPEESVSKYPEGFEDISEEYSNSDLWTLYASYLKYSRININVRQVLKDGSKNLSSR